MRVYHYGFFFYVSNFILQLTIEIKTSIQYKKAELFALNELVKSRFIEMFVEKGFKEITFSDYAEIIDGDRGKNYPNLPNN